VGDGEGVVEDELVVVQAVAEVQGEGVDVRGLRGEDVAGPCFLREVDGIGYLIDISYINMRITLSCYHEVSEYGFRLYMADTS
jgi:hypothetical protein